MAALGSWYGFPAGLQRCSEAGTRYLVSARPYKRKFLLMVLLAVLGGTRRRTSGASVPRLSLAYSLTSTDE